MKNGVGFFGMLTVLFIGLKLAGVIEWSWWLVLLPALIGALLWVVAVILAIAIEVATKQ